MSSNSLADIIQGPALSIPADADIAEALRLMGERRISCLLVEQDGKICGIVTEKDLVRTYAGVAGHACSTVAEIMTASPLTVPHTMGHLEAYRLMTEKGIRHLPVTGIDGEVIGIITESDYIRTLGADYYIRLKDVASAMAPVFILPPEAPLRQALDMLARSDVSCVVIGDVQGARGILTERDVVRLLRSDIPPDVTRVDTVMNHPVVTVGRDSSLLDASTILSEKHIRRVVVVDRDGHPVGILSQHEIVKGLESEYIGHLEALVAEKNRALIELREARQSLEDQSALLQRTLDELSLAHAELREFTKLAAHDLQEPLRAVTNHSQLLTRSLAGRLSDAEHQHFEFIVTGVARMRQSVRDLQSYSAALSQLDSLESVDTGEAARGAQALLQREAEATRAEIRIDELPPVLGRPAMLVELFTALIGNAIKFRRPGIPPRVEVAAKDDGEFWLFTVADNGIGIEEEYLERIFGLFVRLHPADAYGGSGVGLAICRRLAGLLGGRIWAESAPGQGSRFHLTIRKPPAG